MTSRGENAIKIVALVEFCPPRLGSDRRIYELLSRLNENVDVHFVVFPPGRAFLGLIPFSLEHQKDNKKVLRKNITAHYVSVPFFLQKAWNNFLLGYLLTSLYVFPKSFRKIKRINPDIIIINYPSAYTGLFGFLIGKMLTKKVVVEFNDIIAYYTMGLFHEHATSGGTKKKSSFMPILQHVMILTQNYIVKHANLITTLTTYTSRYAKNLGIRKEIHLIPDGVDTSFFDPNRVSRSLKREIRCKYKINEKERVIMYIGRLEKWAGVKLILKCAEQLRHFNAKFLLVGEGNLKLDSSISNIIFCGRIPHESVVNYLSVADLVLVPMQQDTLGQSASPLKLFEAMAMAKPVIASNTQGMRDVIKHGENGLLLPPDETKWAETVTQILENPNLAASLGSNARRTVERIFDWKILIKKFEKLLYLLAKSQKRAG